jgi:hypothetical protein
MQLWNVLAALCISVSVFAKILQLKEVIETLA